ncbi:MAG: energy-coupling factor transporter transmembrane protein EcfT [Deltaproteobacteria bacterium]|nr:energy-coupling factor transporter transmembrane protein EcfT [Deltaproteobacteria bacterium]
MTLLRDLTLGQYLPGASPVHRLDPRVKLVACSLALAAAFAAPSPWVCAAAWPLLGLGVAVSRVPLAYFLRGLRPFVWLLVFTIALHGLTSRGESVWPFPLGSVDVTWQGLGHGAGVSAQLATAVGFSSLLTLTTNPVALVWALERLASPLQRLGLPVGEFCLTILLAIRFLPILREEAERLTIALRARGLDPGTGGLRERVRNLTPLVVPLFQQVFGRAETLARAMEVRGYRPGAPRTSWRVRRVGRADGLALALGALTLAAAVGLGWATPAGLWMTP